MLNKRQINSIARELYPVSSFSRRERKHLRAAMKEEIAEYLEEHPDVGYEDLLEHYADGETPTVMQNSFMGHITKVIVCIGLLIAILCVIFIAVSNTWHPPVYYF